MTSRTDVSLDVREAMPLVALLDSGNFHVSLVDTSVVRVYLVGPEVTPLAVEQLGESLIRAAETMRALAARAWRGMIEVEHQGDEVGA